MIWWIAFELKILPTINNVFGWKYIALGESGKVS